MERLSVIRGADRAGMMASVQAAVMVSRYFFVMFMAGGMFTRIYAKNAGNRFLGEKIWVIFAREFIM